MSQQEVSLDPKKLINAISENLNRHFYADSRDSSKRLFTSIADGQKAPFMRIDMGEAGEVRCELELDHSEHVGKLNYGNFRKGLAMMMLSIKEHLDQGLNLNLMSSATGDLMFHISGIHKSADATNIIVCGLRQMAPGLASVRLMYLNPEHYAEAAMQAATVSKQDAANNSA